MKNLILLLCICSISACADEYIYFGSWSKHLTDHPNSGMQTIEPEKSHPCWKQNACVTGSKYIEEKYNETQNLIGYQKGGLMVGHFKNSYDKSTVIVTKNFQHDHKNLGFILAVGVTHGYTDCDEKEKPGTAKICAHYQAGVAYTKYKIEPVLSITGTVVNLSFRRKI